MVTLYRLFAFAGARNRNHDRSARPDGLGRRHNNVFQPLGQDQDAHPVSAGLQRHAAQSARHGDVHNDQLVPEPARTGFLLFTGQWESVPRALETKTSSFEMCDAR